MREIKFRKWGHYTDGTMRIVDWTILNASNLIDFKCSDGERFMQYTGLKDKNGDVGQEVYEGDIIDEYGKIKGNIYEMDATNSDIIITNLTERDWNDTYKKAMDRGLTHA